MQWLLCACEKKKAERRLKERAVDQDETGTRARALVEAKREDKGGDGEGGGEGEVAGDHQVVRFGEETGHGEG